MAGISASFALLLTVAAAQDDGLLKQAQELFQPLPKDMATAEFPITKERVELGRSLFFDPRLTIDANMSCSSCVLRNRRAAKAHRRQTTSASPSRADQPQFGDEFCHSLAGRPDEPR